MNEVLDNAPEQIFTYKYGDKKMKMPIKYARVNKPKGTLTFYYEYFPKKIEHEALNFLAELKAMPSQLVDPITGYVTAGDKFFHFENMELDDIQYVEFDINESTPLYLEVSWKFESETGGTIF